ncbi:MAG: cation diffusion facilitator family transporter [Solirubrobacterales bacterium]|nr:cation diffusion facilitator family transporter [Solirubrobacterales bacterium]
MSCAVYELVEGDLHRHGELRHAHPHSGPHEHDARAGGPGGSDAHSHPAAHDHSHAYGRAHGDPRAHGHSHGLIDESIRRSREGVRAVALALGVLGCTAAVQALVFALTGSLALLADLIHNGGDALTAVPLGIAFALRSERAERLAGLAVVAAIFASACVAAYEAVVRLVNPSAPSHLVALALAGAVGFAGNRLAGVVRTRAGHRLRSPALIADGDHARVDAYVSLAVIASALAIAAGAPIVDPIIGLGMTVVILRITLQSWRTVRGHHVH